MAALPRRPTVLGLLLLAGLLPGRLAAQGRLFTPLAMRRAYARATRQMDGRPGPRYWQNRGRYAIDLTVRPPSRVVSGMERIVYWNESPDTLSELVVKLFMNSHRPGAPRNLGVAADYLTDGVRIDSFAINGVAQAWQQGTSYTSVPVKLPAPLIPADSVTLAFRWQYQLATLPLREGEVDSTTFFLAYFYPRIAVYDDVDGWDTSDFSDLQEFYSDFNDYEVAVHVPRGFPVWGTGTLTNPEEVLAPAVLRRFEASLRSDTTIRVARPGELSAEPGRSDQSWHFTARAVPDVAFGLSDHYDWDAASVVVDSAAGRRVSVQTAYHDSATDFHYMVQMARAGLAFFSTRFPGVPYPYEKTTVFQGGAGMEYPMMVNDQSYPDTALASAVAGHEIAHSYMPFYMGINETRYPFMDEGWAVTFEYPNNHRIMGSQKAIELFKTFRVIPWQTDASILSDLPIITPADAVRLIGTYRANAYGKPALGYLAVGELLGDAVFDRALKTYMARWHGKHPQPWDLFNTFNDVAGRNLNWFWNNWFFQPGYIDLKLAGVNRTRTGYDVLLENLGGYAAPVDIVVAYRDGSRSIFHQTIGIWEANQARATVRVPTAKPVARIQLSGGIWMDADSSNDSWSAR